MNTKTILYVLRADNIEDGSHCLVKAYMDESEALEALQYCKKWQVLTDDSESVFIKFGLKSRPAGSKPYSQRTKDDLKNMVSNFPLGAYAGCCAMHQASIVELEFDFEFEAYGEMAVIDAEAGIRNVKALEELS